MCKRFARGRFGTAMVLAGALVLSLFSLEVLAQSGCDDLDAVPVTPNVDFDTQIQPIFNNPCTNCHIATHQTGLDLTEGESYGNLINVPSSQDGSWIRVVPSDLGNSLLFHKLNCDAPPVGVRMPFGGPFLTLQQQALFRDWINQGAPGPVETYSIGGTVTGLDGSGLVLQNNGGDNLGIGANGPFTFATELEDGENYNVTVLSQPDNPSQTCTVTNGSGTVSGANVTNVEVDCVTDTFTVGGTVSGLEGSGLVLQNNGGDDLAVGADGSFTFATPLDDGSSYNVTVSVQPGNPQQTCTVSNGGGTVSGSNVTDVMVDCATETFSVGGTVSGLEGSGLVLQNNGGDDLAISADGAFTFSTALADGSPYDVTVAAQPQDPTQNCTVGNGSGTVSGADVTDILVECETLTFSLGGTVSMLEGSGLVLQNNGGDDLAISADGPFTFATELPQGQGYEVTVSVQPGDPEQFCVVENGAGVMPAANVDDVEVECFDQDPEVFRDRFEAE